MLLAAPRVFSSFLRASSTPSLPLTPSAHLSFKMAQGATSLGMGETFAVGSVAAMTAVLM
jgi:hypothetical protein